MMPAYASTPSSAFGQSEQQVTQLSDEDRRKLTEIHELINLLAKELTKISQSAAGQYGLPAAQPVVPYSYSYFQVPFGPGSLAGLRRF